MLFCLFYYMILVGIEFKRKAEDKKTLEIEDIFRAKNFNYLTNAVDSLTGEESGITRSAARLNIGHTLKRCTYQKNDYIVYH